MELFQGLRRELTQLSLGSYFAQVAELISQEDMPNPELQALLLNCLYALSALHLPETMVKAVFELRAACLAGYTPELFGCHVCGNKSPDRFDLSQGQLECSACRDPESGGIRIPVTPQMLEAMQLYLPLCAQKALFLPPGRTDHGRLGSTDGRVLTNPAGARVCHVGFLQVPVCGTL